MNPRRTWIVVFLVAIIPLLGFWLYGLFDLDEGFYAAVAAEMNRRGEWITPYYNGHPWFEKPILIYWAVKPSLMLFGGEVGLRLPSILATIGLYATCAWFASRRLSLRAGQWVVLILCSSFLIAGMGRLVMTDALFNFVFTAAMITFLESLLGDRRWRIASAALLGVSALAKGPVGCILFVVVALLFYWRVKELRPAYKGCWLLGIGVFGLVVASWYVPAWLQNPDFYQKFIVEQNLNRFSGGDKAHTLGGPVNWIFYIPILFLGFLPWSVWLFPAWKNKSDNPALRFMAILAGTVFVFFSISGAKLPHYILPAIAPLAFLVAALFAHREEGKNRPLIPAGAWAAVIIMALVLNLGMWSWYRGVFPGTPDQAEIHRMARNLRSELKSDSLRVAGVVPQVAVFKMGRQKKAMGTGQLKVQETDLPSLMFYLDSVMMSTDRFEGLLKLRQPLVILTRDGRVTNENIFKANRAGFSLTPTVQGRFYSQWLLRPLGD